MGAPTERVPLSVVARYAPAGFAQGLLPLIVGSWLMYYYSPPEAEGQVLLLPATIGLIRLLERIAGAIIEPWFGYLGDRTRSRFGRRRPWMALGMPALLIAFVLLWFPPAATSPDAFSTILHLALVLMVFHAAYSAVFISYNALLPALAKTTEDRVRLSMRMATFEVLSNVAGAVGAAPLVGLGAVTMAGIAFSNGFQVLGMVCGALSLVALLPVLTVDEPEGSVGQVQTYSFFESLRMSAKNRHFLGYGGLMLGMRMASMSSIIAVPFVGTQLMGLDEGQASLLLAVIIIVATLAFPFVERLAVRRGKARVMRWGGVGFICVLPLIGTVGLIPGVSALVHGTVLFALAGFSVATLFVLPRALLADIIDRDASATGHRREASYSGMSGVVEKVGEALATGMVGVLFQFFGNSTEVPMGLRLVGVFAAFGVGLGLLAFSRYEDVA